MVHDNIKPLLELLSLHKGAIVSTASLSSENIRQADAGGRMYVDEHSLGFVWMPDINTFPDTEEKVAQFEKWFPLGVDIQNFKFPTDHVIKN